MKIDEIIIKLCSERGYDPSQVNDYPTLLEQLECIKELLKTYPNQQYYTVKAYTYTANTKKFSFKISDVNNYGRQINIGDILIVTLASNILEIAQISSLDVEAGNGIADDVGQLTGSKGDTGPQGPKGDTGPQGPKGDTAESGPKYMNFLYMGVTEDVKLQNVKLEANKVYMFFNVDTKNYQEIDVGSEFNWIANLKPMKYIGGDSLPVYTFNGYTMYQVNALFTDPSDSQEGLYISCMTTEDGASLIDEKMSQEDHLLFVDFTNSAFTYYFQSVELK